MKIFQKSNYLDVCLKSGKSVSDFFILKFLKIFSRRSRIFMNLMNCLPDKQHHQHQQ